MAFLKVGHGLRCHVRKGVDDTEMTATDEGVEEDESTTTSPPSGSTSLPPSQVDGELPSNPLSPSSQEKILAAASSPLSTLPSDSSFKAFFPSLYMPLVPPLGNQGALAPRTLSSLSDAHLFDLLARERLARKVTTSAAAIQKSEALLMAGQWAEYRARKQQEQKLAMALLSSANLRGQNWDV